MSQKILNRSTSFVEVFPLRQGGNHSILKKNRPGVSVGLGGSKFGPNGKRRKRRKRRRGVAITPNWCELGM